MLFVIHLKVYRYILNNLHLKNHDSYQIDNNGESWEDQGREREDHGQGLYAYCLSFFEMRIETKFKRIMLNNQV